MLYCTPVKTLAKNPDQDQDQQKKQIKDCTMAVSLYCKNIIVRNSTQFNLRLKH